MKIYSEKKLTKLHGPWVPSLIKNVFIQNEKKQNYHGPWVPNLILNYQALYIKYGFFWIASKNFIFWDNREGEGD